MHGTQGSNRPNRLHGAKNALSIMHRHDPISHKVPAGSLKPSNLVWRARNRHTDRFPDKTQVRCLLLREEVTFLPVEAPAQNHKEQSRYLSMEESLGRGGSLDEDVIHVDGNQDSPCHSQEGYNRFEEPCENPRATFEPKGKDLPLKEGFQPMES